MAQSKHNLTAAGETEQPAGVAACELWDKAASVDFIAPGRGRVHTIMQIDRQEVEIIRELAQTGQPIYRTYPVEVLAEDGSLVAKVEKVLYIRKKR